MKRSLRKILLLYHMVGSVVYSVLNWYGVSTVSVPMCIQLAHVPFKTP